MSPISGFASASDEAVIPIGLSKCQPAAPEKTDPQDKVQRDRFIEAARKAGASEGEADFDKALKQVAKQKPGAQDKVRR